MIEVIAPVILGLDWPPEDTVALKQSDDGTDLRTVTVTMSEMRAIAAARAFS